MPEKHRHKLAGIQRLHQLPAQLNHQIKSLIPQNNRCSPASASCLNVQAAVHAAYGSSHTGPRSCRMTPELSVGLTQNAAGMQHVCVCVCVCVTMCVLTLINPMNTK